MDISAWFTKIRKRESSKFYRLAGLSLFLIFITSIPWLFAWWQTPTGSRLWGVQPYNEIDTPVYFSYINQVKDGAWLLKDFYTSENLPAMFNPFWLMVGWLARFLALSAFKAYQLARIILIPVFLVVLDFFLGELKIEGDRRWWTTLMVVFSSGLGALVGAILAFFHGSFNQLVPDIQIPEAFTFFTLFHSPHFIASITFILLTFALFLRAIDRRSWRSAILAGLSALFLFQFHPYYILLIYAVTGSYAAWVFYKYHFNAFKYLVAVVVISLPAVLYYYFQLKNSLMAIKASQSVTLSPPLWALVVGYGLLIPLAVAGWKIWKKEYPETWSKSASFIFIWLALSAALIYAPVVYQRRFFEGPQVAVAILASFGLLAATEFLKKFKMLDIIIWPLLAVLLLGSNVSIWEADWQSNSYLHDSFLQAAAWLRTTTPADSVIMVSRNTGNPLAALSSRTVWSGHGHETIFAQSKDLVVDWLFAPTINAAGKAALLKKLGINYIFYGSEERALGRLPPDLFPQVFSNGDVQIYKVL